jgi:hypothetical protein
MLNSPSDLNDVSESPGLCPEHGLPMDRTRPAWPSSTMRLCAACDARVTEQRAWLDEVPITADDPDAAMRALVRLFNDARL